MPPTPPVPPPGSFKATASFMLGTKGLKKKPEVAVAPSKRQDAPPPLERTFDPVRTSESPPPLSPKPFVVRRARSFDVDEILAPQKEKSEQTESFSQSPPLSPRGSPGHDARRRSSKSPSPISQRIRVKRGSLEDVRQKERRRKSKLLKKEGKREKEFITEGKER